MERQTVAPGIFRHDNSPGKPSIKESSRGKRPGCSPITPHRIPVVENQYPRISFVTKALSVQSTIFYATDMAISVRKYYNILKATAGDLPGVKFA
jgi:hypothetical protein